MDTTHTNKYNIAGGKNTIIIIKPNTTKINDITTTTNRLEVDEGRKRRIQQQKWREINERNIKNR